VSGDFDFGDLFKDPVPEDDVAAATGGVQSLTGEIGAFLQEPDIQLAVERNGHVPSSEGVAIEPAEDYTLHTVVARLDRMTSTLLDLTLLIRESLMIHAPGATSAQVAELLEGVEPPTQGGSSAAELLAGPDDTGEPPTSAEPPKPPRSRRKG
jgi:hypothetical protein